MTGHEYEYLVAKYLRQHGYSRVEVTKGSGDYGVDVTAYKRGKKYAVQCKYYSEPVSLPAVQEAVAGKAVYNCDFAMVVTNSTFTPNATELAKKNGVILLSGVTSAQSTIKDFLIVAAVIFVALILFFLAAGFVAGFETIKTQFVNREYNKAIANCLSVLCIPALVTVLVLLIRKLNHK